jgi:hypothetical protein
MKFIPKTDEQIKEESNKYKPLPEGIYDVQVILSHSFGQYEALTEDTISKAGKEMIVLVVKIFHKNDDKFSVVKDYLVNDPRMIWKIKQASKTFGLLKDYDKGDLKAISFIGKTGKAKVVIKQDDKGIDRNNITQYIFEEPAIENDDEIPM